MKRSRPFSLILSFSFLHQRSDFIQKTPFVFRQKEFLLAGEAGFARFAAARDTPTVFSTVHRTVEMPYSTDLFESRLKKKSKEQQMLFPWIWLGRRDFVPCCRTIASLRSLPRRRKQSTGLFSSAGFACSLLVRIPFVF